MAFGFPAYHTEEYAVRPCGGDLYGAVLDTLDQLGWSVTSEEEGVIRASTSVSIWSWGKRITIELLTGGALLITSKCALPTQCLDWGKNRRNVTRFLKELRNYV